MTPEFSRPVEIAPVFRKGAVTLLLEANAEEREAVARRLGLLQLDSLTAELSLAPWQGEGLEVRGDLAADFSQTCVVTLEPFPSHVQEPVEAQYLPEAEAALIRPDETLSDPAEPDPPEPLPAAGFIDLGELIIQHLAVALDPYPRKPGVAFAQPESGPLEGAGNPFAKLAALKRPPKG